VPGGAAGVRRGDVGDEPAGHEAGGGEHAAGQHGAARQARAHDVGEVRLGGRVGAEVVDVVDLDISGGVGIGHGIPSNARRRLRRSPGT
jgi:hypothetical protein